MPPPDEGGTLRKHIVLAGATALALTLAACSSGGTGSGTGSAAPGGTVTVVTHDSWAVDSEVLAAFEESSGLKLNFVAPGDAGTLVNQLILTKDNPLGDVVYGVDNTFAQRAIDEGVFTPYFPADADGRVAALSAVMGGELTAIDFGDVCINVDHEYFAEAGIPEPVTLEDLTKPEYANMLVVTDPATSSPGMAFLIATIGAFGPDGWQDYWRQLKDNGVKVVSSWSDAYYVDFSGPSSEGDRPLALSYASSPPYEVSDGATEAPTGALLETCFRQVEFAGVLAGAANPEGAQQVIDWLVSDAFQTQIPGNMYMYPASESVELPEEWAKFAPLAPSPFEVDAADIENNRETWISEWSTIVVG